VGFLVSFIVCFKWALKKRVFFGWSNYMNSEDNYRRLVDFLSQISNCPISTFLI